MVFPNKWKLQNPSLPLFPPCQASSCDPSSPSDGSPCACSPGPWPLPFSCSSPGTREETCNDSRQIQKRFQKEYTSCETAKHENVPNVTTFLLMLVDSNYIHTKKGMNFKFPIKIWELPATRAAIPLWIWRFQICQCQFWSLEILPPNQLFAKIKHISSCLLSPLFLQKDHPKVALSALTKYVYQSASSLRFQIKFGFRFSL